MAGDCFCQTHSKSGGLEERQREKRRISVAADGKLWLEHDLTRVDESRLT